MKKQESPGFSRGEHVNIALATVPADDLRGAGPLATVALLHLLLALRSGPRPMGDVDTEVVEATSAPEGT